MAEIKEEVVIAKVDYGEGARNASIERKSGQQLARKGFEGVEPRRVGIAFQGGVFPAGAMAAGAVKYLVEAGAFDDERYEIDAFSGTSSGSLVASVCWGNKMKGTMKLAPQILEKQWLHYALAGCGKRARF